jgi:hypothetical protein
MRRIGGSRVVVKADDGRIAARGRKWVLKTKKPAAGFRKEPNSDWEEERRCSMVALGGGKVDQSETPREEVQRFDK